ncbi:MAG TPA: nucleoside deaminase [Candidatus Pelagibacter bacterium]|jgi:tRNA(Arg) A34 adenosine deaminase TadA|nr:nucleoside deaminase [Candidatus Pelagibacter bacterium]|tara:strand:- start:594 stop:1184 length:591 start_codon:yes stop_codon:yes gene_type:complete
MSEILLDKFLDIFKNDILPLTIKGVDAGNKIFGAAIINKDDYSLVVAGSNNETENPIWHGEIHTLKKFYELDNIMRPKEKNCIFLSSHEPCSLCLSGITFSGFDNFYYLFPYESTSDEFNIPHDLNILKEVFNITDGKYMKENSYWKSYNINILLNEMKNANKKKLADSFNEIKKTYIDLSKKYQSLKEKNSIPLK